MICAVCLVAVLGLAMLIPSAAHAKGGHSTSSTNVSIPPEQWFEAIGRETLMGNAWNKARNAPAWWDMAHQAVGMERGHKNPYPLAPKGPFEWTHEDHQGSSWGRDWAGGNMPGPYGGAVPYGGESPGFLGRAAGNSGGTRNRAVLERPPWEMGLDPRNYREKVRRHEGDETKVWERISPGYANTPVMPREPFPTRNIPERPRLDLTVTPKEPLAPWQERLQRPIMQDLGQGLGHMERSLAGARGALGYQGESLHGATGAFDKAKGFFGQASGSFNQGNQFASQAAEAARGGQRFFDKAASVAGQMGEPIGKLGTLGDEMRNGLLQGKLPQGYQDNWMKGNKRGFDTLLGNSLNNLASRGVMNSSVANRSLGEATDRMNESYARNYLGSMAAARANYDSTAQKYGGQIQGLGAQAQGYQGAGQGYLGSSNALTHAGQTANASGKGFMGAGQGMLGVGQGHLGAAQGWGSHYKNQLTDAQAAMMPYQARLNAMKEMMGVGDQQGKDLHNLYSMWRSHRYGVPGDTVVSGGK